MLRLIYSYTAGYDQKENEPEVTVRVTDLIVDINMIDLDVDGAQKEIDPEAEKNTYFKYKDDVKSFCKAIDFSVGQDAIDHSITNYFNKRVTEKEEFPWVEVYNIRLKCSLIPDEPDEEDEEIYEA